MTVAENGMWSEPHFFRQPPNEKDYDSDIFD